MKLWTSIDDKRKELFLEDHTQKSFAGDELAYVEESQKRIPTLHDLRRTSVRHQAYNGAYQPVEEVSITRKESIIIV